jgi:DNA-binding XRE family transcriptional regulator
VVTEYVEVAKETINSIEEEIKRRGGNGGVVA